MAGIDAQIPNVSGQVRLLCKALDCTGVRPYSEQAEKTALTRCQECGGNHGARLEIATICIPPPCTGAVGPVFVIGRRDVLGNLVNELLSQVNHGHDKPQIAQGSDRI
jgi:hypothetical protein